MKNLRYIAKHAIASVAAFALLLSSAAAETNTPYKTDTGIRLTLINPVSNITVGDEVYVRAEADSGDIRNLWGYEFEFEYNEDFLSYKEAESGLTGGVYAEKEEPGKVKLAFSKTEVGSIKEALATLKFIARKAGTGEVTLLWAAVVNSDMGYEEFENMNSNLTIPIVSRPAANGGFGGGGYSGGGGMFSVNGMPNTVTGTAQNLEPVASDEPNYEYPSLNGDIFNDLSGYEWAKDAIEKLYNLGSVEGYRDGGFHPGSNVTRAEFCKIVLTALGAELPSEATSNFEDVDVAEWYAPYISAAYKLEIINGYDDGTFRPNGDITREEAAAIISRAIDTLNLLQNDVRLNVNFADEDEIDEIFVGYVDKLYMMGIVNGDDDGFFRPLDSISRAETAQMTVNLLDAIGGETAEPSIGPKPSSDSEGFSTPKGRKPAKNDDFIPVAELPEDEIGSDEPSESRGPAESERPTETPLPEPSYEPGSTEAPTDTPFREDVIFDCESTEELYSFENIYAYEIPDDGSRSAFYDDFTTFQRPGPGNAFVVYKIPYCEEIRAETYFYGGEPVRDFSFELSREGENWSNGDFTVSYLEAENKWTRGDYTIDAADDMPYIKINYPETINSWTPLISKITATVGAPRPTGAVIEGETEPIIPLYGSRDYKYVATLTDQIGEPYPGKMKLSITDSDIPDLSISDSGVITVTSDMKDGGEFTIRAELGEFVAELRPKLKKALWGDLDGSGSVDKADIDIIVKNYGKRIDSDDWASIRDGDINQDNKISIIDIAYITKKAVDSIE